MEVTIHAEEVMSQELDIFKIYINIDVLLVKSFRKSSNKLILDRSKRKYMKSLASYKPPEVYKEVNKFIRVSYSKPLIFN